MTKSNGTSGSTNGYKTKNTFNGTTKTDVASTVKAKICNKHSEKVGNDTKILNNLNGNESGKNSAAVLKTTSINSELDSHELSLNEKELQNLENIATQLLQDGKGILATDETSEEIQCRLTSCGLDNTIENRRRYRQLLLTTPNLSKYISGIILHGETYEQKTEKGESLADLVLRQNINVGICVDLGRVPFTGSKYELTTQGLDNLHQRLQRYKLGGCSFAKWCCAYHISDATPSHLALTENASVLARYASICQREGVLPIIEAAICTEGKHDLKRSQKATENVLSHIYKALALQNVYLEGTILRTTFVTPGTAATEQATTHEITQATLTALRRTVPTAVPGIALLADHHSAVNATQYLNSINQESQENFKLWRLTFGFGLALEAQVLQVWAGHGENVRAAQQILEQRAKANSEAAQGKYVSEKAVFASLLDGVNVDHVKPYY